MKYIHLLTLFTIGNLLASQTLEFSSVKNHARNKEIRKEFFQKIKELFNPTTFIETGTYLGDTTKNAAPYFEEIHTVELSDYYYQISQNNLKDIDNITTHKGDSRIILSNILPTISNKILFWIDAHYCGGVTAGENDDPLLGELGAIKESGITNAVILIDDIRGWNSEEIIGVYNAIMSINPDYTFCIYGDIAIAFSPNENIDLSPLLIACTKSRLHQGLAIDPALLEAEEIIGNITGEEKTAILAIPYKESGYYHLWQGLIHLSDFNYIKAVSLFNKANQNGLPLWRVTSYINQATSIIL